MLTDEELNQAIKVLHAIIEHHKDAFLLRRDVLTADLGSERANHLREFIAIIAGVMVGNVVMRALDEEKGE